MLASFDVPSPPISIGSCSRRLRYIVPDRSPAIPHPVIQASLMDTRLRGANATRDAGSVGTPCLAPDRLQGPPWAQTIHQRAPNSNAIRSAQCAITKTPSTAAYLHGAHTNYDADFTGTSSPGSARFKGLPWAQTIHQGVAVGGARKATPSQTARIVTE